MTASCEHVPSRFYGRFRDSVDVDAGRAIVKGLAAIDRLLAGEATSLLLSGPPGTGKTLLAAVGANESVKELQAELTAATHRSWEHENEYKAFTSMPWRQDDLAAHTARASELEGQSKKIHGELGRLYRQLEWNCPRWVSVPLFLGSLRREMNGSDRPAAAELSEILEQANAPLVLDDVGREKVSDWTAEILHELVASRYEVGATVILTSNLSAAELGRVGYGPMVSRVADEGILLEMRTAPDYRMTKLRRSVA